MASQMETWMTLMMAWKILMGDDGVAEVDPAIVCKAVVGGMNMILFCYLDVELIF